VYGLGAMYRIRCEDINSMERHEDEGWMSES
jgi:hypothetical protein